MIFEDQLKAVDHLSDEALADINVVLSDEDYVLFFRDEQ